MSYESLYMNIHKPTDYVAALFLAATMNDNTKENNMNGFSMWAARIRNSNNAIIKQLEDIWVLAHVNYPCVGHVFNGNNVQWMSGEDKPISVENLIKAPIGTEIINHYHNASGYGTEIWTKIDKVWWAKTHEGFTSYCNQQSDYIYDPIDGYTYNVDMIEMSYDDNNDTYSVLEAQASKPRGSQKYRAC